MKKIIALAFVLAAFAVVGNAQKTQPKAPKAQTAQTTTQTYTLTRDGVDVLQIGKTFVAKPKAGSVYDVAVKADRALYNLKKGGKVIGSAYVSGGKLLGFTISSKSVVLNNGIKVGMPITEAVQKDRVKTTFFIEADDAGEWPSFSVSCDGIVIEGGQLSESGQKVIEKIQGDLDSGNFDYDSYKYPELKVSDFDGKSTVTSFHVGEKWIEGFSM